MSRLGFCPVTVGAAGRGPSSEEAVGLGVTQLWDGVLRPPRLLALARHPGRTLVSWVRSEQTQGGAL